MRPFKRTLYCKTCRSNTLHKIDRIKAVVIDYVHLKSICQICRTLRTDTLSNDNLIKLAFRTETDLPNSQSFI